MSNYIGRCKKCFEQLDSVKPLQPDSQLAENILHVSRGRYQKVSMLQTIKSGIHKLLTPKKLIWEVVFSTAVIILLIYVRPIQQNQPVLSEDVLAWDDDFYSEVDYMGQELDRVESGTLISSYVNSEEMDYEEKREWLSPMSMDLPAIRQEVQDIVTGIYGI